MFPKMFRNYILLDYVFRKIVKKEKRKKYLKIIFNFTIRRLKIVEKVLKMLISIDNI
jgi:hypothetical protein